MATTPKGYPYPAATDAPDGPGGLYNLAIALDNTTGTWTPSLGGGAGESLGTGSSTIGNYFQLANFVAFTGRLAFGSGAPSLGTNPTITGLPYNVMQSTATGGGHWLRTGVTPVRITLVATSPSQMAIYFASAVTVQQSDTIVFNVIGSKV